MISRVRGNCKGVWLRESNETDVSRGGKNNNRTTALSRGPNNFLDVIKKKLKEWFYQMGENATQTPILKIKILQRLIEFLIDSLSPPKPPHLWGIPRPCGPLRPMRDLKRIRALSTPCVHQQRTS
jgi:hypothetical protein